MTDNNFFDNSNNMDNQAQEQPQESQEVVLGEKSFTQEEIEQAVGLAEQARELEEKWDTKLDKLMPAYSKVTNENSELAKRNAELQAQIENLTTQKAQEQGGPLTPEQEEKIIREQAKKFGLVTSEDFDKYYEQRRTAEKEQEMAQRLIGEATNFLEAQASEGKPKAKVEDLVDFMDERGITDYESAYKIKYEKELDDWKIRQATTNRPSGVYTQSQSTAGAKQPVERQVNSENLGDAIKETLARYS